MYKIIVTYEKRQGKFNLYQTVNRTVFEFDESEAEEIDSLLEKLDKLTEEFGGEEN